MGLNRENKNTFGSYIGFVYICDKIRFSYLIANMSNEDSTLILTDYKQFIHEILMQGRISFSMEEISNLGSSKIAVKQALARMTDNNEIYPVRRGFYVIVTPEYSHSNIVPETMFVDDLMSYIKCEYYVSLLSAAALHGAGHQQPMSYYITHNGNALRDINSAKHKIAFVRKNEWNATITEKKKTRSGYIIVSTPEATLLDLIEQQKRFGLSRISEIAIELFDLIRSQNLHQTALLYPIALRQRLGYILDLLGLPSETVYRTLKKCVTHPTYLSLSATKEGKLDSKWNILVNEHIEIDNL